MAAGFPPASKGGILPPAPASASSQGIPGTLQTPRRRAGSHGLLAGWKAATAILVVKMRVFAF